MNIGDCMKPNVVSIRATASISEAASTMVTSHVGLLPVVTSKDRPIGMITLQELLTLELPDFVRLLEDVDFVHDFGAVESTRPEPELLEQPITTLMRPVMTVEETGGLLHAYALMIKHDLTDLPVINSKGELTGIVSRVDIGTTVLSIWRSGKQVN
jgi:CBS-domain-containing membrane protein